MADSSLSILDSTGATVVLDAQLPAAGERQQTVTIGDGATPGLVANIAADGALEVQSNIATGATLTNVTASVTSVTIVAANAVRRGIIFFNDSTSVLFLHYGSGAASATSFTVKLAAAGMFFMDVPVYTGAITGIWTTANGACRVTDLSA